MSRAQYSPDFMQPPSKPNPQNTNGKKITVTEAYNKGFADAKTHRQLRDHYKNPDVYDAYHQGFRDGKNMEHQ